MSTSQGPNLVANRQPVLRKPAFGAGENVGGNKGGRYIDRINSGTQEVRVTVTLGDGVGGNKEQ